MKRTAFLLIGATVAFATVAAAEVIAPDDVVFNDDGSVSTSLTGVAGDTENGQKVMVTKSLGNCVACHQVTALDYAAFHGNIGPSLDGVGDRYDEATLRGIVINAKRTFKDSMMPPMYKTSGFIRPGDFKGHSVPNPPSILTAQQVEDVVAFLQTLK